jgi:hypothetical protein
MYYGDDFGSKRPKRTSGRVLYGVTADNAGLQSLKRATAQIEVAGAANDGGKKTKVVDALIILNELTPTQVSVFSESPFLGAQPVTIHIQGFRGTFTINGRITACKEIPINYGIVSKKSYHYRVEVSFVYENEQAAKNIMDYYFDLRDNFLAPAA